MNNTMIIQVNNRKVLKLLLDLEELQLLKVLKNDIETQIQRPSGRYRGMLSKEQGKALDDHINQIRSEWNVI
jgi:hypothetical protein